METPSFESTVQRLLAERGKLTNRDLVQAMVTIARAYQANAIPMIVLLDAKGVVQKVHVGYTEREVLEEEIHTLLDGKSLAPAKEKDEAKPKD